MANAPHCGGRGRLHGESYSNGYGLRGHARTLDHREAFDFAGECGPCAILSVNCPVRMDIPATVSPWSENDTDLLNVKREVIV